MTDKDKDGKNALGCGIAVFSLCVTTPMWLALLFALMSTNAMPTWAWVLYWCYVPTSVLGVVLAGIARHLMEN